MSQQPADDIGVYCLTSSLSDFSSGKPLVVNVDLSNSIPHETSDDVWRSDGFEGIAHKLTEDQARKLHRKLGESLERIEHFRELSKVRNIGDVYNKKN